MNRWMKIGLALFASTAIAACGSSNDDDLTSAPPPTIAEAAQDGGFTALLAAADKAELSAVLSAPDSQLTVFAPSNAAFDQLAGRLGFANAGAMVDALPAAALRNILSYHVLPAKKSGSDLIGGGATQSTLYAFEGQPASLAISGQGGVTLTDAALLQSSVTTADIAASNGVIHAIDRVLIPPGVLTIVQMAQANPQFSSLVDAVVTANLQDVLGGAGPLTVFAPTNAAFANAPAGLSTEQLATVLAYHVLPAQVLAAQIPFGTPVATAANQSLTINSGTPPTITDTTATPAAIIATDVRASNGVIHVIDKVLIPAL